MDKPPAEGGQTRYVVAVKDGHSPDDVAADLTKMGFQVERVLPKIGVVGGRGHGDLWKQISQAPGVELVRTEGVVQLPPFSEDVPQ